MAFAVDRPVHMTHQRAPAAEFPVISADNSPAFDRDAGTKLIGLNRLFGWEDRGIKFEGTLTYDSSVVLSGGARPGATGGRNLLELRMVADTEKLFHRDWRGGNVTLIYQSFRGENGSSDTGDAIMYTNNDNVFPVSQLAVAYYEQ